MYIYIYILKISKQSKISKISDIFHIFENITIFSNPEADTISTAFERFKRIN